MNLDRTPKKKRILIGIIWFWSANPSPEGKAQIFPPISWVKGYFGYCVCSANRVLLLPLWYLKINRVKLLICFRLLDLIDLSWLVQSVEDWVDDALYFMNLLLIFGFSDIKRSESEEDEHENLNMLLLFDFMFVGRWNGMVTERVGFVGWNLSVQFWNWKALRLWPFCLALNSWIPLSAPKISFGKLGFVFPSI